MQLKSTILDALTSLSDEETVTLRRGFQTSTIDRPCSWCLGTGMADTGIKCSSCKGRGSVLVPM
jgi:hypothetical protein